MANNTLHRVNEKIYKPLVWLLRIVIGGVFIIAGFTKAIDPWGFYYKVVDYLNVWGIDWASRDMIIVGATTLSAIEFTVGVLLLTGCLRRAICWVILGLMAFMLPLTTYIAIYNPVNDCGCFGDAFVISNNATLLKNILITLGTIYLLKENKRVFGVVAPLVQWLVIVASVFYCMVLGFYGYNIQPLMDFRSYKVGTTLAEDDDIGIKLIYERDGETKEYEVDSLPDSTWTYVGRTQPTKNTRSAFAIYDGDEEVTSEVLSAHGPQLLLLVSDPNTHRKARASMANNLSAYIEKLGGTMIGVVATSPDSLDKWISTAHPNYEVFTSDDTTIKEIVRGDAGLVYLSDGKIKWKRSVYSLPADFPDFKTKDNALDNVHAIDSGARLEDITLMYLMSLLIITVLGVYKLFKLRKTTPKSPSKTTNVPQCPHPSEPSEASETSEASEVSEPSEALEASATWETSSDASDISEPSSETAKSSDKETSETPPEA